MTIESPRQKVMSGKWQTDNERARLCENGEYNYDLTEEINMRPDDYLTQAYKQATILTQAMCPKEAPFYPAYDLILIRRCGNGPGDYYAITMQPLPDAT